MKDKLFFMFGTIHEGSHMVYKFLGKSFLLEATIAVSLFGFVQY
jgi:hypothetical protein